MRANAAQPSGTVSGFEAELERVLRSIGDTRPGDAGNSVATGRARALHLATVAVRHRRGTAGVDGRGRTDQRALTGGRARVAGGPQRRHAEHATEARGVGPIDAGGDHPTELATLAVRALEGLKQVRGVARWRRAGCHAGRDAVLVLGTVGTSDAGREPIRVEGAWREPLAAFAELREARRAEATLLEGDTGLASATARRTGVAGTGTDPRPGQRAAGHATVCESRIDSWDTGQPRRAVTDADAEGAQLRGARLSGWEAAGRRDTRAGRPRTDLARGTGRSVQAAARPTHHGSVGLGSRDEALVTRTPRSRLTNFAMPVGSAGGPSTERRLTDAHSALSEGAGSAGQ